MRRAAVVILAALCLTTCGGADPIPDTDLLLRVTLGAETVAPGEGFAVTVVRVWRKDMEAAGWDEALLSPLVLRLQDTSRREDERRIEETHRYLAYAFTLKDVEIPAPVFAARPKDGGMPRVVTSDRIRLRVQPVLDPAAPGEPELPGAPPAPPRRWGWVLWLSGLLALVAVLGLAHRRHKARFAHPPESPTAQGEALGRLATTADVVAVANVLRDYVQQRFDVSARERTTEEVLAAVPSQHLADVLQEADEVKFASGPSNDAQLERALATAEAYVRETAQ